MTVNWHEGDVVRKLRAVAGWTLQELAHASGVNIQVIHRLEAGATKEPKRATLTRLAEAFGLTARELADAVPPPVELSINVKRGGRHATRRAG
jgi:transcriptional regulator with XRE-family HTH domain